ncbi:ATP-binding protein [Tissierella praeacuta]|uniref:two-component system sensor histidine kinase NtrB n=1 Tax=Tissierella praeacuta TaxID=43131 RepID=UPI0035155FF8
MQYNNKNDNIVLKRYKKEVDKGMLYSSVSCNVEKTLQKIKESDINALLALDYFALVTVTISGNVIIDGSINYSDEDETLFIEILERYRDDLFNTRNSLTYNVDDKLCSLIIVPIREQDNYRVYSVTSKLYLTYDERDLAIMEFVSKTFYENTVLDNEIIKEKNLLRNIFDSVDSFIISIDLDGRITSANKATYDILGISPELAIGKLCKEYLFQKDFDRIKKITYKIINEKSIDNIQDETIINTNYGKVTIDLNISAVHDNKNEVVGIVLVGTDTTLKKIDAKEIEQLNQFALTGELAAGIAHDIRNPLMSIRGCARILEKKLKSDYLVTEFVEPIVNEVDRIDSIIRNMLSYSYITKEATYSLFDINELLKNCINVTNFHKLSRHINIRSNIEKSLPLIGGNNVQIQQAFINILLNAVQAIEADGTITISTYKMNKERLIVTTIEDDGIGMDDEILKNIFSPLYTNKSTGTGFGLSIAKRVIEKHGGMIEVKSKLGIGTKFIIYLPY